MNKFFVAASLASCALLALGAYAESTHPHESHIHEELVDGKKLQIDPDQFEEFVKGLSQSQIAIVSVKGMVCDFCAQAIEKVFMKRDEVTGITINLEEQNVTIALKQNNDIEDNIIKELFLDSGYNVSEIDRKKL